MSAEAISWVYRCSRSKGRARGVLMWIAYHADENGEGAYPSVYTLSNFTGSVPRTVCRGLRQLERMHELHTEIAGSVTGTNVYSIPGVRKEKSIHPCQPDTPRKRAYTYKEERKQQELWSELHVGAGPR